MKRTIIAVGTAAALGLVVSAAHAVAYFGPAATTPAGVNEATGLEQAAGGAGHMLFAPYFNVQGHNATSISIVNTDTQNGKAVKVRFRSAANSDDLLDFTLLLSPGDVWTGTMVQDASGVGILTTEDNSCALPGFGVGVTQNMRLPGYIGDELQKLHMREGYIEVLNMADIPQRTAGVGQPPTLYQSIKHSAGVPLDCDSAAVVALYDDLDTTTQAGADSAGLTAPTGGLVGSWLIMNQDQYASFSGAMTAIRAIDGAGKNGYGNIAFAPQSSEPFIVDASWSNGKATDVNKLSSDPLFVANDKGERLLDPLWFDLPDMSTPLVSKFDGDPLGQVASMGLQHTAVMNEYSADPTGALPITTDWVVSQPTRRYYAAVAYGGSASGSALARVSPSESNPYYSKLSRQIIDGMPFACIGGLKVQTKNREEGGTQSGAEWSPGASVTTCGEVFTLTFGGSSPMNALATNAKVSSVAGKAGWGTIRTGTALPLVGFGATAAQNMDTGIHYGMTLPHRWND